MKTGENLAREYQIPSETQIMQVESNQSKVYLGVKYIIDILFSLIGLFFLWPIILIFSLLIILESPGSPFYLQERVGLKEKNLELLSYVL